MYAGLRLKILEECKVIGTIIVKEVEDAKNFTAKDENDPENINEFRFLEKTKAWHLVFEGLGGEHCIKEDTPYALCPISM